MLRQLTRAAVRAGPRDVSTGGYACRSLAAAVSPAPRRLAKRLSRNTARGRWHRFTAPSSASIAPNHARHYGRGFCSATGPDGDDAGDSVTETDVDAGAAGADELASEPEHEEGEGEEEEGEQEEDLPAPLSYDNLNPVEKGDTQYVRERRQWRSQVSEYRKRYAQRPEPRPKAPTITRKQRLAKMVIKPSKNREREISRQKKTIEDIVSYRNASLELENKSIKKKKQGRRKWRVDNRKRDEEDMKNLELIMLREADAGKWLWRTEDVDSWVYRKMFGWNVR